MSKSDCLLKTHTIGRREGARVERGAEGYRMCSLTIGCVLLL